jgi:sulfatase maturation enzyme AslB (radical SAM superfamily)
LLNDYNNWCPEIYRGLFVDQINDDKIRVAPCCQAKSSIELVDSFDFTLSPHLTKLRQEFDSGNYPSDCDNCWKVEKSGHKSRRQSAIEFFNISPPNNDVILEGFDHSATWACNLACIMCGPNSSSTWASELNYTNTELINIGRQFQKSNQFLDKIDLSNIKKIHFNGGEPLLNNDQYKLLAELENQGVLEDTFISYNTNGTIMPSTKIINLWKKARLVKLFFSIDATKSAFEYIRWPAKWETVTSNLLAMKEQLPHNVMFGFNVTVGCYNLFEMVDLCNWFEQNLQSNRENDQSDFNWQLANNFPIESLNQSAKISAIKSLNSIPRLHGIVNYIKSTLTAVENNKWITALDKIDQRRGTNWQKSLQIAKYY